MKKDERRREQNKNKPVYDCYPDFNQHRDDDVGYFNQALESCLVNRLFDKEKGRSAVEAQELSRDGAKLLHVLRRFLRRKHDKQCVALIASSTNQSLANCCPDPEERKSSREGEPESDHWKSGDALHPPFFALFTMGCFVNEIAFSPQDAWSEFDKATPCGRPLFVRLLFPEKTDNPGGFCCPVDAKSCMSNDDLCIVTTRMLLNHTRPFDGHTTTLLPFASVWELVYSWEAFTRRWRKSSWQKNTHT